MSARRHGNKLLLTRQAVEELTRGPVESDALTLRDWAEAVEAQRQAGALGDSSAGSSAADLLLGDRARRQAT